MKKIFYSFTAGIALIGLALVVLFGGCTKVNDSFNQHEYDSLTRITNNVTYKYTLLDADYTAISKLVQKPIADQIAPIQTNQNTSQDSITKKLYVDKADSIRIQARITLLKAQIATLKLDATYVMGGNVSTYKYLPKGVISGSWVPSWMNTKYLYADIDSKTILTYNAEYDTLAPIPIPSGSKYTLKAADYNAMKVTTPTGGPFFDSKYLPTYFIPLWLKVSFPYAIAGDRWLIRYSYNTGTAATPVVSKRWLVSTFDGTNWSATGFATPQTLQYAFKADGWHMDPTITVALVKGSPNNTYVMVFLDYLRIHSTDATNPTKWYPKLAYINEEHYYGFSAYYPEIICTGDRSIYGDAAIKALSSDEAKYALFRQRVAEGMPLFTQVNFPSLKKEVSGLQQYVIFTIPSYYSSSKSGMYTIKMKCIVSATDSAPAEYEVESCVEVLN